jgi:hypothetical protein
MTGAVVHHDRLPEGTLSGLRGNGAGERVLRRRSGQLSPTDVTAAVYVRGDAAVTSR